MLQPAISAAYAYRDDDRPLNVVLLSDGMTEAGEQAELLRLIQVAPAGVRVFCIGVGNEVNRPLLDQMATQAGGLAAFVSTEDSFARQAQLMRQKLVRPAIEDLWSNSMAARFTMSNRIAGRSVLRDAAAAVWPLRSRRTRWQSRCGRSKADRGNRPSK